MIFRMLQLLYLLALHFVYITGHASLATEDSKIWSVCVNGSCNDGDSVNNVVYYDNEFVWIKTCFCLYYDHEQNKTILGNCMLTCFYVHFHELGRNYYKTERVSKENGSQLNEKVCGISFAHVDMHREGRFCGRCKEGYGLAVYSYHYKSCIPCSDSSYKNWLLYFTVALLPLTVFYFLVVILKLNVTSSRFNGIVFILQCVSSSMQLRMLDAWVYGTPSIFRILFQIVSVFMGMINLDFFRTIYPYFCLHPKLSILHVVVLDYVVALYPFLLILVTYILVTMYDNNYRVITMAWKPFKWCLNHYHGHVQPKSSLVEVFATFILLSNVKILGVSFDLLTPTRSWDASGATLDKWYLYYDSNIEYFSPQHLPFALLGLAMGVIFFLLPSLLLVCYPCRCFQHCLSLTGYNFRALRIFMDAFQGSYKTEPRDLRQFSSLYLLLRFLLLSSTSAFLSVAYTTFCGVVILLSTIIFAIFQPYKNSLHNKFDLVSLLLLSLLFISLTDFSNSIYVNWQYYNLSIAFFIGSVVLICVHCIVFFFYHCKSRMIFKVLRKRPSEDVGAGLSESMDIRNAKPQTPLLSSRLLDPVN